MRPKWRCLGCTRYLRDVTVDDVKIGSAWTAITRQRCCSVPLPGSSGGGYGWSERGVGNGVVVAENTLTTSKENNSVYVAGRPVSVTA